MRVLLDTHTWLWWLFEPARVSQAAQGALVAANERYLSAVSAWEISIKLQLNKLSLPIPLERVLDELQKQNIGWLAISREHCCHVRALPLHHRDPFDRMLVAQANVDGLAILSCDQKLDAYGNQRIW